MIIPIPIMRGSYGPPTCIHCGKAYPFGEGLLDRHTWLIIPMILSIVWFVLTVMWWMMDWSINKQYTLVQAVVAQAEFVANMLRHIW